ncbi:MAG: hypothetical protein ACTSRP_28370 [Candidatus Helarchaeota archaeon]
MKNGHSKIFYITICLLFLVGVLFIFSSNYNLTLRIRNINNAPNEHGNQLINDSTTYYNQVFYVDVIVNSSENNYINCTFERDVYIYSDNKSYIANVTFVNCTFKKGYGFYAYNNSNIYFYDSKDKNLNIIWSDRNYFRLFDNSSVYFLNKTYYSPDFQNRFELYHNSSIFCDNSDLEYIFYLELYNNSEFFLNNSKLYIREYLYLYDNAKFKLFNNSDLKISSGSNYYLEMYDNSQIFAKNSTMHYIQAKFYDISYGYIENSTFNQCEIGLKDNSTLFINDSNTGLSSDEDLIILYPSFPKLYILNSVIKMDISISDLGISEDLAPFIKINNSILYRRMLNFEQISSNTTIEIYDSKLFCNQTVQFFQLVTYYYTFGSNCTIKIFNSHIGSLMITGNATLYFEKVIVHYNLTLENEINNHIKSYINKANVYQTFTN